MKLIINLNLLSEDVITTYKARFDEYNLNNDYYIDDLAIYIIEEEDDIWIAFSFLDEIEYDNFINYMEEES